ncbi:YitT family protein [Paenibacillus shenyangensis]|uniref:YitT family protein n=1 Tax=Paenibacillus sp. A9 TaxID=1284352 RepID=UPI00068729BA|nr:YitT family protein [Paenibacillus sp. A9]
MRRRTNWNTSWLVAGKQILAILLGTFILAFAYYHINFYNNLSEGGFVGLALLGKYLFGWSPAWSTFVLDIPVILLAWWLKGHRFMVYTLIGAASFSIFYSGFEQLSPFVVDLHGNLLIAAALSGLLTGLGAGIVLRYGGATGGDDVLSRLISEWKGWKIGNVFFIGDVIVLGLCLFFLPFKETMYTMLAVWLAGKMITWTINVKVGFKLPHFMRPDKSAAPIQIPVKTTASVQQSH